ETTTVTSTETSTESTTKATTETSTESSTETSTKATSETNTESSTETSTKATSETNTESSTETSTKAITETSTESSTETSTKATSDTSTESSTENTTKATSETSTETKTENTTETTTGKVSSDDSGKITDYDGNEEIVNIPDSVNGVPVTAIGADFLKNNETVKDVVLPDTISNIETNALNGVEVYANINSKAAETVKEYNKNNPEKPISLNYIGDIDGKNGITNDDIQKILDYVRDSDNSLTDKEIQNAKVLLPNRKITATTAAKIFYLMNIAKD
ncbi:MAG: hypothetical protein IJ736_00840, partial [Firmicutes bacterium]|nr:hypothetical protein [Bacillota bacterium]